MPLLSISLREIAQTLGECFGKLSTHCQASGVSMAAARSSGASLPDPARWRSGLACRSRGPQSGPARSRPALGLRGGRALDRVPEPHSGQRPLGVVPDRPDRTPESRRLANRDLMAGVELNRPSARRSGSQCGVSLRPLAVLQGEELRSPSRMRVCIEALCAPACGERDARFVFPSRDQVSVELAHDGVCGGLVDREGEAAIVRRVRHQVDLLLAAQALEQRR